MYVSRFPETWTYRNDRKPLETWRFLAQFEIEFIQVIHNNRLV